MNLFMRYPGFKTKAFTMSYDDGVEQDMRLVEIMDKYSLKGTFNISSGLFAADGTVYEKGRIHRPMTEKTAIKLYLDSGNEVALHGFTHPFLEQLPTNRAMYEIIEDRRRLENHIGRIVRGMAYPFGTLNDEVVSMIKSAGISYARATKSTEKFSLPAEPLRLQPTCHHNNPKLLKLGGEFLKKEVIHDPQLFYLWGHSYEFEANDNWNVIEDFAKLISGDGGVWYATNIEIFDYIEAYKRLRFSVDMKIAENPSSTDLFFSWNEKDYVVPAGETAVL